MFKKPQLSLTDFQNQKLSGFETFEILVPQSVIEKARIPDELLDEIFRCGTPTHNEKLK